MSGSVLLSDISPDTKSMCRWSPLASAIMPGAMSFNHRGDSIGVRPSAPKAFIFSSFHGERLLGVVEAVEFTAAGSL